MKEFKYIVEEESNVRIDRYISNQDCALSRSRIQGMIEDHHVLVNGNFVKCNYKVKINDEILVHVQDDEELKAIPEDLPLDIRYEDKDVLVINKAKGMVVHPAPGSLHGTVVNAVLYHCKDLSGINGVLRPGIVHRIDKDTTGLLIIAKNDEAHRALAQQLEKKSLHRLYYALVHGVITHDHGTIDAPIGRDPNDRQKMMVTATNSKDARTHFKVIERFQNYTLIECRLETGRTHQIRVHMQYIKHPIVGDTKYSFRKTMNTNGQLLHAHQLVFQHPTLDEEMCVEAPLPDDFQTVLEELRQKEG
ncbi:MAG: RluA family pseudouridine synthase [Erysipelotrichaceae bacterium]|nr:RluA family pseudouridine synthase [Erysipelotrichaceae bacterium]